MCGKEEEEEVGRTNAEWNSVGRGRRGMVHLTSASILRYNGTSADPYLLGTATDLSTFNYFQRSSVREMLAFTSRTVARRTPENTRQSVEHQVQREVYIYVYVYRLASTTLLCLYVDAYVETMPACAAQTAGRACMRVSSSS